MLPSISISSDLDRLAQWARRIGSDQLPFATTLALTRTAKDAADALTAAMPHELDRPTPFTQKAWAFQRASKTDLTARVFAKDAQAKYLQYQVFGGNRAPTNVALKLPAQIKLNEFGNIPRAEIKRLIQLAQEGKRLTRVRGARLGISSKLDLFYGDPGNGMPPGIFKRVQQGSVHHLVPIVLFPHIVAHYTPRIPMRATVERVVRARFGANWSDAWAQAMRSAR